MGIEKRLQLIMASNRLNATSFADKIGVQRSNLSHILNGRNKPGYDFLLKVVEAFPNVNTHWLITGDETAPESESIKEPETIVRESKQESDPTDLNNNNSSAPGRSAAGKTVIKTVIFYNDFTFDVFLPNN